MPIKSNNQLQYYSIYNIVTDFNSDVYKSVILFLDINDLKNTHHFVKLFKQYGFILNIHPAI